MKTAMQEWFDELKANYPYMADDIYKKGFDKYLEKEKEQIIKAVEDTRGNIVPKMFIGENLSGQEYYNQTYNQEETLEEWKSKFTHHCAIKTNNL